MTIIPRSLFFCKNAIYFHDNTLFLVNVFQAPTSNWPNMVKVSGFCNYAKSKIQTHRRNFKTNRQKQSTSCLEYIINVLFLSPEPVHKSQLPCPYYARKY
jgi:hypothetical protein